MPPPLQSQGVPVDDYCDGFRWAVQDETELAKLIAIIAMGQSAHAASILAVLGRAAPAFTNADLYRDAKITLTVQDVAATPRTGYPRFQRDGFIFEVISWIAARQDPSDLLLLLPPHVRSTSQGVDGLMIQLNKDKSEVLATTVFEDKCTDAPRDYFRDRVMAAFHARHRNERSAELVSAATALLQGAGLVGTSAVQLAAAVIDNGKRRYRAAFALTAAYDSQDERAKLFKDYDELKPLNKEQRLAAGLIVNGALREWFDALAAQSVTYIDQLLAEMV